MKLNKLISTDIRLRGFDASGKCVSEQRVKNTLTNAAAGVFMNALLKSGPSEVKFLYLRFGDSGANPAYLAPLGGDLKKTVRSDFLVDQGSTGVKGGMWVPLLSAPAQATSDVSLYNGNQASFFFRIPHNIPAAQVEPDNFVVATSYIYAMGLAVPQHVTDRTQDLIVSVLQAYGSGGDVNSEKFTKFQIPPGGQYAVDYPLTMEI